MLRKLKDVDIEAFIEFAKYNMNAAETARHLYRHRNNIEYHLKKVERVTGLNPFRFYDLIQLLQLAGVITIQCDCFRKTEEE